MEKITFKVDASVKDRIDAKIKAEFPRLRTTSDVIREALDQFLEGIQSGVAT